MRLFSRPILAALAASAMTIAGGCGGSDEPQTTASIPGPAGENPASAPGSSPTKTAPAADPMHPQVAIETSLGKITIELDRENSPLTVDNFVRYVQSGHYDQTIFHQIVKDCPKVVLGGAFSAELVEKPTSTPIRNEAHNGLHNVRGTVAMARAPDAIDSATCHFFINAADNTEMLDHRDRTLEGYGYCVFGKVVQGMDVVDRMMELPVHNTDDFERIPAQTVMIESAHLLR